MRLFELVLQNVPPQKIARSIVQAVANANNISTTIKHFLHSIMDAIGFNYYVTTDEISKNQFRWPKEEAGYFIFHYEQTVFERYRIFLEKTCKIMNQESLLEQMVTIITAFLNLYNSMEESFEDNFREPFSLISYSLLYSMHMIRKDSADPHLVLDDICHRLFKNAQKGLGYPDSHEVVMKGLCLVLEKDYDCFHRFDENICQFYKNCMEYEVCFICIQTNTPYPDAAQKQRFIGFKTCFNKFVGTIGHLFICMRNAVNNRNIEPGPRESLVKFITDAKMIKAYCVFAENGTRNLVCSLLKFLNSLLKYLPVQECFNREQVHIIFSHALREHTQNRSLAVQFYLTYMKKSFADKLIFRDILDFFLMKADNIDRLDNFFGSLWEKFSYMTKFHPYLRIFKKADYSETILSIAAQFAYRVYQKLYSECEDNDGYALRLSKFLLELPSVLNLLGNKFQIRGILLQIYSITDPDLAIVTIKDFPIAADNFIKFALQYLTKCDGDLILAQNTACCMLTWMEFLNMQDEMEYFASSVYEKYKELVSSSSELTEDQVNILEHALVLLSVFSDTTSALNEKNVFELLSDLRTHLIESNMFRELSAKHNCCIDSLGITTYSGCLNILSVICAQITTDESNTESSVLLGQVHLFLKYLLDCLGDDNQSDVTIVFAEAAMRALCDLYIVFNFEMERQVYHIMVSAVNKHVFNASVSTTDSLRQVERQRNILHCFNLLHKFVEIPTAITWKVIIHYGIAANFENELTELMDILFEYNSEKFKKPSLFTYVVPVAIYNLFQRRVPIKQFCKAIKAYKKYVEGKIPDRTQRIMKVHIVLTMIDMIERAVRAGGINLQPNRIELLSNLNILLTDVYEQDRNLILTQSRRLQRHTLSRNEHDTLATFQERLSQ